MKRNLLIRVLHPFFLAGEWWVRYTERLAADQEERAATRRNR